MAFDRTMLKTENVTIESSTFLPCATAPGTLIIETSGFRLTRMVEGEKAIMKKAVRQDCNEDKTLRASLRKEYETGRIVSKQTPYIVNYLSFADTPAECYIKMDYIDGETLDNFITRHPDYFRRQDNLRRFLVQLLSALDAIHQCQIIHLDLKPGNIMMTRVNSDVRIIDLGMCYSDTWPTNIGTTEEFAAPEVLNLTNDIDARADLYSVGKIVTYIQHRLSDGRNFKLHRDIRKVVTRCLKQDKTKRWQTAAEAVAVLQPDPKSRYLTIAVLFTMAAAVILFLALGTGRRDTPPAVFMGDCGVLYEVISEDSATCRVKQLSAKTKLSNIYIHSYASYNNKQYQVVEIGDSAFSGTKIVSIGMPATLKHIGVASFKDCVKLAFIDIPDNVTSIGHTAFWGCTAVNSLRLSKNLKVIPSECFSQIEVTDLYIPEGIETIEYDAFGICPKIKDVSFPKSLKAIGRGVFWNCKSLRTVTIPSSVKEIGILAFTGCKSLTDVYNYSLVPQNAISLFSNPDVTIHVPRNAAPLYRESPSWGKYRIVEMH